MHRFSQKDWIWLVLEPLSTEPRGRSFTSLGDFFHLHPLNFLDLEPSTLNLETGHIAFSLFLRKQEENQSNIYLIWSTFGKIYSTILARHFHLSGAKNRLILYKMDETQPLLAEVRLIDTERCDDISHKDIVDFDIHGDAENPMEWPTAYKWGIVSVMACMAFTVYVITFFSSRYTQNPYN